MDVMKVAEVVEVNEAAAKKPLVNRLAKLLEVKSLVTLTLTGGMLALLFGPFQPSAEAVGLFCTSYGAVITYFFTRKELGE